MRIALVLPILLALWAPLTASAVATESANPETQTIVRYEARWDVQQSGASDDDLYAVTFVNPVLGWAVGQNNTILRTRDGGETWARSVNRQDRGPQFTEVTFVDEMHGWVKARDTLLYTANGGDSWQPAASLSRTVNSYGPGSVVGNTRFQLAVPGLDNNLYRSDDGGRSWTQVGRLPRNNFDHLDFADLTRGWAAQGTGGELAMTQDGGATWTIVNQRVYRTPKVQFVNASTGWVFGEQGATLLATTDGGQSWIPQATGLRPSQGLNDLHFLNQGVGYLLSDSESGIVLMTTDGGASWQQIGTLGASAHVRAVRFPDTEHGWVVGDRGFIIHYHLIPVDEDMAPGEGT